MAHTKLSRSSFNLKYMGNRVFEVSYYTPHRLIKKSALTIESDLPLIDHLLHKDTTNRKWSQRDMAALIKIATRNDKRHKREDYSNSVKNQPKGKEHPNSPLHKKSLRHQTHTKKLKAQPLTKKLPDLLRRLSIIRKQKYWERIKYNRQKSGKKPKPKPKQKPKSKLKQKQNIVTRKTKFTNLPHAKSVAISKCRVTNATHYIYYNNRLKKYGVRKTPYIAQYETLCIEITPGNEPTLKYL